MTNKPKAKRKDPMVSRKIRFKVEEINRIQMLADIYAGGNFSKWIRYAGMNCDRKVLANANK